MTSIVPSIHESTERILRNGKRRGSSTTVTPNSTTKTKSFKIPETPKPTNNNTNDDDETGDNYSSRSISPTTSAISTTSSSPPLSNTNNNESPMITNPIDLSNTKSNEENDLSDSKYHFTNNDILYPSTDSFNVPSSSPSSSFLPISSQIYFNSLTSPHYSPTVSSLTKSTN